MTTTIARKLLEIGASHFIMVRWNGGFGPKNLLIMRLNPVLSPVSIAFCILQGE